MKAEAACWEDNPQGGASLDLVEVTMVVEHTAAAAAPTAAEADVET